MPSGVPLDLAKEQFSDAYLRAVAAVAGCQCSKLTPDVDKIDWTIRWPGGGAKVISPNVDVQLKCTEDCPNRDSPRFAVDIETYDALRDERVAVPRILVVVFVPKDTADWIEQSEDQLALRRCGYWASLRGRTPTDNKDNITVPLPRDQLFTVAALRGILDTIGQGGAP
jgi:hypothetical protein